MGLETMQRVHLVLKKTTFRRLLQILMSLILCVMLVKIFHSMVQSSSTLSYSQHSAAFNQLIARSSWARTYEIRGNNGNNLIANNVTKEGKPKTTEAKNMVKTKSVRSGSSTYGLYIWSEGRFGNHMFQYASLFGIAKATGRTGYESIWGNISDIFAESIHSLKVKNPPENLKVLKEKKAGVFAEYLMKDLPKEDVTLCCYLQSWKYFKNSENELRTIFTFKPRTLNQVKVIIERLTQTHLNNINRISNHEIPLPQNHSIQEFKRKMNLTVDELTLVGLHIRQGDLIQSFLIDIGFKMASNSYFKKAMDYFKKKYKNVLFLLCSDDAEKIKSSNNSLFHSYDIEIITGTDDIQDLALLSLCHHTIMSVGTFSWWAAWLAGGEATYYKDWPIPNTNLSSEYNHEDYFLPYWIPIGD